MLAVEANQTILVDDLIRSKEADLEIRDSEGNTAYMLAIKSGHPEMVVALTEHGATTHTINTHGMTTLMMIASSKTLSVFEVGKFLQTCSNAEINAKDNRGYTALMYAMELRPNIVANLKNNGATYDPKDPVAVALAEKLPPKIKRILLGADQLAVASAASSSPEEPASSSRVKDRIMAGMFGDNLKLPNVSNGTSANASVPKVIPSLGGNTPTSG